MSVDTIVVASRIPATLAAQFNELADRQGRTKAALIRAFIEQAIAAENGTEVAR